MSPFLLSPHWMVSRVHPWCGVSQCLCWPPGDREQFVGERASLGNLYSCSVRDGSRKSKWHYRNLLLKEHLSSTSFHFFHLHTHAWKGQWDAWNKQCFSSPKPTVIWHQVTRQKNAIPVRLCLSLSWLALWFSYFFFICCLLSLPPGGVFLLPQREHDGIPLPMPTVSQLPALPGLLLEGTCWGFP